jgi:tetratricopeptide (TPR) repeat protein
LIETYVSVLESPPLSSKKTAEPAEAARAGMANMGSLARVALPEILKTVALSERSGSLEVTAGRSVRTIYFDRGFIVFTASNSEKDRLGQCLLEAGALTEKELELAASLMKGRRRIGEAIVEAGYLTQDELGRALAQQARRIATSLFAVESGMYRFEEQDCPIPLELRLSLSIYRIQLEGIRQMKNEKLITSQLPPPSSALRLSRRPPFSFEEIRFLPIELLVMEAAQKERPLEGVVERVKKGRDTVLRAIYGLLSAGILEPARAAARPLKVQEETGGFLLSKLEEERSEPAANVRQEVLLGFESSEHASPTELLEVSAEASPEEIEDAFRKRQAAWQDKQKGLDNEKTLCLKVEEIQARLARARDQLLGAGRPPEPEHEEPAKKERSSSSAEVKRLLKEIKVRRMVDDTEGVISLLYEVVSLEPENAKYEAMLAQALGSHPVMKSKAERHFRRALSLDPQSAEVHYLLGRYYQSFDMRSRALAEFKAALAIDPRLSEARSALVEIKGEGEGTIQDKLKRLFV